MVTSASGRAFIAATLRRRSSRRSGKGATRSNVHAVSDPVMTIPFLANATKPTDLEFEGAECDVDASGNRMTCAFQQLFLTTSPLAPDTCLVTTNRYDRVFQRDSSSHWTSTEGPGRRLRTARRGHATGRRRRQVDAGVEEDGDEAGRGSSLSDGRYDARDLQLAEHPTLAALQVRPARRRYAVEFRQRFLSLTAPTRSSAAARTARPSTHRLCRMIR